jgi:hypothetical protein
MTIMSLKDRIRFGKLHKSGKKKMVFDGVTYSVSKSRKRGKK